MLETLVFRGLSEDDSTVQPSIVLYCSRTSLIIQQGCTVWNGMAHYQKEHINSSGPIIISII